MKARLRFTLLATAATLAGAGAPSVAAPLMGRGVLREEPRGRAVRWSVLGARTVSSRALAARPGRLVFDEVYAGIALTLDSSPDGVEYRFDVAPGADPSAIRMRYEGAEDLAVEDDGKVLRLRAGGRELRERGLRCFQEIAAARHNVDCSYDVRLAPDGAFEVAIAIGAYDRARALVIDPTIDWASFLGGASNDAGYAVAVDSSANAYVTGDTASSDFPSAGGFDSILGAARDAFVTKVNAAGTLVWSSYLGGSGYDAGYGIAVDATGDIYVTGETWSSDFPPTGGFDTMLSGASDAFVAKVNGDGSGLAWSSFLGGSGQDEFGNAVAVDDLENVYVLGSTFSTDFPSGGGFDPSLDGMRDAFVTKVDAAGSTLAWSSYLGGSDTDYGGSGIAVDGARDVYVTGTTYSSDFPSTGGFDTSFGAPRDAFVTKVNAAGTTLAWSSYLGGSFYEEGYGLAVDSTGNVYVTGVTASSDFPSTGGFDSGLFGGEDAFVAKVDAAGSSLAWSSYLGGNGGDQGRAIAVDISRNAYVTGYTSAADFPSTGGFDTSLGGFQDAFVTKVAAAGSSLAWSSYLGGSMDEYGYGIAVNDAVVYLAGSTYSSDFPSTGGFDTSLGGTVDAFVTRVNVCGSCGDGCCGAAETTCGCPDDCGQTCGDFCCNGGETYCTCPAECGPSCGDGCCTAPENACAGPGCDTDCGASCGDGCCTGTENACAGPGCDTDCGASCGDGCCTAPETKCGCADCIPDVCGDGCCTGGEDSIGCPTDCPVTCGDTTCAPPLEDTCNCPGDCGSSCGDGCCTGVEDACSGLGCDTECPASCGDGCCTGAENACAGPGCDTDCPASCGDGCCTGGEDCSTCPGDCGSCPEIGPEPMPDLGPEAPPDAAPDGILDAGPDVTPDAAPDVTPDVAEDLGTDLSADVPADGPPPDSARDGGPAPGAESVYGCPCNLGRGPGSPSSLLAILGLALLLRRRRG